MRLPPRATSESQYFFKVFLWYIVMFVVVLPHLNLCVQILRIYSWRMWNSLGLPHHQFTLNEVTRYGYPYTGQPADFSILSNALGAMALVGLLGWIGYRVIARRQRPRWHRFIRYWWMSCRLATILLPLVFLFMAVVPRVYLPITPVASISLDSLLFLPLIVGYICFSPAFFAVREARRKGRAVWPRCLRCGYALRGLSTQVCPECGLPFPRGPIAAQTMKN